MIAIGRGAYMHKVKGCPDLSAQNACGIAGDSLWLGGMMCHRVKNNTGDTETMPKENGGDGKKRWQVRTYPPRNYTIHGMDAFDGRFAQAPEDFDEKKYNPEDKTTWIHKAQKDIAGGSITLAAGRGTGTADGGSLILQTAPAGVKSQNRKNPLKTAVKIDTDYKTKGATPMWLYDNNANKLKRVYVGEPDSGGKGFRALVIEN
jgi:hypothetical protein